MLTLDEFIKMLQELSEKGYGDLQVYATHGASGSCSVVTGAYLNFVDIDWVSYPFDLQDGDRYIDISIDA